MKKVLGIITGILGIIIGLIIIYYGIADKSIPKPLAITMAIVCILDAVFILWNYLNKRN